MPWVRRGAAVFFCCCVTWYISDSKIEHLEVFFKNIILINRQCFIFFSKKFLIFIYFAPDSPLIPISHLTYICCFCASNWSVQPEAKKLPPRFRNNKQQTTIPNVKYLTAGVERRFVDFGWCQHWWRWYNFLTVLGVLVDVSWRNNKNRTNCQTK